MVLDLKLIYAVCYMIGFVIGFVVAWIFQVIKDNIGK
jgi:hypothetical protein